MIHNYRFADINEGLPLLAHELLSKGDEFGSRAGRTMELMHVGITFDSPWQREIVQPIRKASVAAQIVETMWVLAGRNDVATLLPYLPRAGEFSDDGYTWRAGYGPRLRSFGGDEHHEPVDQLAYLVDTMRRSPGSRQAVASIWDPEVDTKPGKDIACNNWLSLSSRHGALDLHVAIRSNDLIWGWSGINAFEWSVLQEVVAGLAGLRTGRLHFSITSLHLYDRHWEKARQLGELSFSPRYDASPRFDASACPTLERFDALVAEWFNLEQQIRTGQDIGLNVDRFPEPMMRSWLRVLQWYWSGEIAYLLPLQGSRLYHAALAGVAPAGEPQQPSAWEETEREMDGLLAGLPERPSFLEFTLALHVEKHAAYGDSWKRRGEPGILGNIARKVDRLDAGSSTADETPFDTAMDLAVYLAKYASWLAGGSGSPEEVEVILGEYEKGWADEPVSDLPELIIEGFEFLEKLTEDGAASDQKQHVTETLLSQAYSLARARY